MPLPETLAAALLIDAAIGDPAAVYRKIPHPVALMGRLIAGLEWRLNTPATSPHRRFARGLLTAAAVVALAAAAGGLAQAFCAGWSHGWLLEAVAASTLIAARSLYLHVRAVGQALDDSLASARDAVSHIVGRDPAFLDEAAVARAAVESAAENFADGVAAPVFWFALLGLPGLCAYKAINTLDSMLGYRNERFEHFGKCAARLDDAANWLPARLSALAITAAAALTPEASPARAWRTVVADAKRHRSPNAGWPEAAMAGALGFALAGPRRYAQGWVDDHWMGDGNADLRAHDIRRALSLYVTACVLTAIISVVGVTITGSSSAALALATAG